MRGSRWAAPFLAAIACLAPAARAAVATSTVRVTSGAPPYTISYYLAQDISGGQGTMTVNIRKATDNAIIKSWVVTDDMAMLKGFHPMDLAWDGTQTNGTPAPSGTYYAEIVTTAVPNPTIKVLTEPVQWLDTTVGSVAFDGRGQYGGGVNLNPADPYHNLAYTGSRASNDNARSGVLVNNVDASTFAFFRPTGTATLDWISAEVLPGDGNVVVAGQSSGTVKVLSKADGSILQNYGGGRVLVRTIDAFGDAEHPELFFIDGGTPGVGGAGSLGYIADLSAFTPTSAAVSLVTAATLGGTPKGLVVNKEKTAAYVSGTAGTPAMGFIKKINLIKDGNGVVTGATVDPGFTFTNPAAYPTGANHQWVDLSADGSVLWYAINEGNTSDASNRIIQGLNPDTGASLGADYTLSGMSWNPQDVMATSGGNLYITTYVSLLTGSTSRMTAVVAPPDNGSTDTTRSLDFVATTSTTNNITSGPTVEDITYHGATIKWTTQFPANATVEYGLDTGYGQSVTQTGVPSASNVVPLDLLAPGTTYYFKVISRLAGMDDAVATGQFTTAPLTISNVQIPRDLLSSESVTITWSTNEPSTSYVRYGEFSGDLTRRAGNATLTKEHSVTISGLSPLTNWYYAAESGWPGAPPVLSAEGQFTTPSGNLIISETFSASGASATLGFTLINPASATVKYGASPDSLTNTASVSGGGSTALSATMNGLAAGGVIYYSIELTDASIGGTSRYIGTFTMPATGGTPKTVTHSTMADLRGSVAHNVQMGGAGNLLRLQRQGVPGTPVTGPDLPEGNYYSGVTVANGFMYVVLGANAAAAPVNTVYFIPLNADGTLDAVAGWKTTTPLPSARVALNDQVTAYNNWLYVVGGGTSTSAHTATVFRARINADGTLGPWQSDRALPVARSFGGALPLNGHLLVSGGFDVADRATNYIAEIRPDGSLGPWSLTSNLDTPRNFHRTVTSGPYVYAVSDFDGSSMAYFRTSPTGEVGPAIPLPPDLPAKQYAMAAGLLGGKIVVAAGRTQDNVPISPAAINYVKILQDGTLDFGWNTAVDPYPVGSLDLDGAAYNGRLYAAGGRTMFSGSTPNPTPMAVMIPMVDDPFDTGYAYDGQLESGVIDLGGVGSLTRLTVSGSGLTAGNISVRYRFAKEASGNGAPLFSDWFTTSGPDAAISGGGRYVQYQVNFQGDGASTPTVSSIALTASVTSSVLPGDVNRNGIPNEFADAVLALRVAGGLISSLDPSVSYENARVTGGSEIGIQDAATILRRANGL